MANTTFTGNVRANGDGSRNTRAGSMLMAATFHVPSTAAAAGTACQVSATDTSALPKYSGLIIVFLAILSYSIVLLTVVLGARSTVILSLVLRLCADEL